MQDKMINGVVEIEKIDLDSYNNGIYSPFETTVPQCNDINWNMLLSEFMYGVGNSSIPITTPPSGSLSTYWSIKFAIVDFKQSPINLGIPCCTTLAASSAVEAKTNSGYPLFVAKTLPTDKDYIQFVADLLPGATTRTIYGLGIGVYLGYGAFFISGNDGSITNLRLNTPCVQSTSTVLRVTYKLYLDDEFTSLTSNISDGFFSAVRNVLKNSANGTYSNSFSAPQYPYYYSSSYYDLSSLSISKPCNLNLESSYNQLSNKLSDTGITYTNHINFPITANAFPISGSNSLTDLYSMGTFARSLVLYGNLYNSGMLYSTPFGSYIADSPFMSQKILPTGISPVQNIFKQAAGASGPFQDLNYLGTMKGNITIDGSNWVTQKYPKVFKVNIVTGGDVNTATYTVETLNFTGGFMQNTYVPRDAMLPQDGLNNLSTTYYKNNFKDAYTLDAVNFGGTTIRTPDNNKYVVAASCNRTRNAISIYNIEDGSKIVLNSTSTPSLPVTNVSDIAVSNGYTFVTCSATGLWQIDPTFTTVTHLTSIGAGVDSSKAYQIDVKSNGDLWVLFEGGLCKGVSGDSGATWSWTVYNTSNGFTAAGITDSNWSNVTSMCVDPAHANDRILFVLGLASSDNSYAAGFIWWERSTSTTTVMTTGVEYPSFSLSSNLQRSDLIRCINGYWFTSVETANSTSKTYHTCTWSGATPPTSWTSKETGSPLSTAARFIPATVAGVSGALVGSISSYSSGNRTQFPDTTSKTVDATPAFFINGSNFGSLPETLNTQSIIEFFVKYGPLDTTTTQLEYYSGGFAYFNGATPVCYLPNSNMVFYWNDSFGKFSVSPIVPKSTITNYSTYKPAAWKSYGWNGSTWVLGNTNAKTTHTTSDTFFDGLKIAFSNGLSTPNFVAGESFVFVVGDGLMKDNATDYSFIYTVYPHNTEKVSTFYDLTSGVKTTVPNKAVGQLVDEYVNCTPNAQFSSSRSSFKFQQKKGMLSGGSIGTLYSDNIVPYSSPFTFKFKLGSLPLVDQQKWMQLVYWNGSKVTNTPYSLNITDTSVSFRINNGERSAYIPTSLDTEYTLSRGLDNVIRFYVDGVLYCSSAIDETYPNTPESILIYPQLSDQYDGLLGFYDMKLSYYENRRLLRIGDPSNNSGYFNDNYCGLTFTNGTNDDKIVIGGVTQTISHSYGGGTVSSPNVKINTGAALVEFPSLPTVSISNSDFVSYWIPPSIVPIMATSKSVNKTILVVGGGAGYTNGTYPLVITGGGGTGAAGTATISGGVVTSATITTGGSGYTSIPTISVDTSAGTPTTAATLTANIGYAISSFLILNSGSGMGLSTSATISGPTGTGGHTATATITMEPTMSLLGVVIISNTGAGYTDGVYTAVFSDGGATVQATGNVYIKNGKVIYVEVTTGGSGYTSAPSLTFTGAGTPTIPATFNTNIGYRIQSINLTDGGSGYIPHADLPITGYATAHYHL